MATKPSKTLNRHELLKGHQDQIQDAERDLVRVQIETQKARDAMVRMKSERDIALRTLVEFDRSIREARAEYERLLDQQNVIQTDINHHKSGMMALGAV